MHRFPLLLYPQCLKVSPNPTNFLPFPLRFKARREKMLVSKLRKNNKFRIFFLLSRKKSKSPRVTFDFGKCMSQFRLPYR